MPFNATYHRASPASSFQPFMFPSWHTCCLEFLPDHALFWAVIHLLQPPQGFFILHVTTTAKKKKIIQLFLVKYNTTAFLIFVPSYSPSPYNQATKTLIPTDCSNPLKNCCN